MPNVSFALADGRSMPVEQARGNVLVIAFFTIWCPASAKALHAVDELRARNVGVTDLAVLAVDEGDKPDDVNAFLTKQGVKANLVFDKGGAIASELGLPTMPSVLVIDRSGLIRHLFAGYHGDEDGLAIGSAVANLLAERPATETDR